MESKTFLILNEIILTLKDVRFKCIIFIDIRQNFDGLILTVMKSQKEVVSIIIGIQLYYVGQ